VEPLVDGDQDDRRHRVVAHELHGSRERLRPDFLVAEHFATEVDDRDSSAPSPTAGARFLTTSMISWLSPSPSAAGSWAAHSNC